MRASPFLFFFLERQYPGLAPEAEFKAILWILMFPASYKNTWSIHRHRAGNGLNEITPCCVAGCPTITTANLQLRWEGILQIFVNESLILC